jgi:hypothetical protein
LETVRSSWVRLPYGGHPVVRRYNLKYGNAGDEYDKA